MLSRRQLRVKVLQALYAFFQSDKKELSVAERELFRSIEKVHELYVYLLQFLLELADADESDASDLLTKYFPDQAELKASLRLSAFRFMHALRDSDSFKAAVRKCKTSWQKDRELVRRVFLELKKSSEFRAIITGEDKDESAFLQLIVRKYVEESDLMQHHVEEENLFWPEDLSFVSHMVNRTIRQFYDSGKLEVFTSYRDEKDDREFVSALFHQTVLHNKEYEAAVSERTKNWDLERIALMDILILKMALAELVHFQAIPVKVTINEFIEISKEYSTPKSKQFINGIIDRLAADYREAGKIVKTGRGLME
ncbi:MAG: transcription antitermination factor NusB [Bacteroidota bacterium]|jgi:N utilization substance protein B